MFFNCIFGLKQKCNSFPLLDNGKESVVYGVEVEQELVLYSTERIKEFSKKISIARIEVHKGNAYKLLDSNKYDRICIVGSSYLSKVHTYVHRQRWREIPETFERRRNYDCKFFCSFLTTDNVKIDFLARKDSHHSL